MDKHLARQLGLQRRQALSKTQRDTYGEIIQHQVLSMLDEHQTVGIYVSMKEEVDTYWLIEQCVKQHKRIVVPKVVGQTLQFYPFISFSHLKKGNFGVLEPVDGKPVTLDEITAMVVPLSSFDQYCHRTGYGKGYYDSILYQIPFKIGVGYFVQKVDLIQVESHDISLDVIVHELGSEKK